MACGLGYELDDQLQLFLDTVTYQRVPPIMNTLAPFDTFQFVEIPSDYQTLVRQFYQEQCRNCRKQLQHNAICLICGEVLCFYPQPRCCKDLPAMKPDEGELSYHARVWEGGCSIFLVPSLGEVLMIDDGRIARYDTFYRNELG
jgi:hypothetical protein